MTSSKSLGVVSVSITRASTASSTASPATNSKIDVSTGLGGGGGDVGGGKGKMVTFGGTNSSGRANMDKGATDGKGGASNSGSPPSNTVRWCNQCARGRHPCNLHLPIGGTGAGGGPGGIALDGRNGSKGSVSGDSPGPAQARAQHQVVRPRRLSKLQRRATTSSNSRKQQKQPDFALHPNATEDHDHHNNRNHKAGAPTEDIEIDDPLTGSNAPGSRNTTTMSKIVLTYTPPTPHPTTISSISESDIPIPSNITTAGTSTSTSTRRRSTRSSASASASKPTSSMDPPVLSFYGTEPVPLPTRFAHIKRSLVAGHEAALSASWNRLLAALREEVAHIESLGGPHLTPGIDFAELSDASKASDFARELKRYGVGVVRGVVPRADCARYVADTARYIEAQRDFKAPTPQDPTCFDFFWTPAQVRVRAHPNVLRAQKFMMGLWDGEAGDRMATRCPIVYADRIRIHGASVGDGRSGEGDGDGEGGKGDGEGRGGASSVGASTTEAQKAAVELLGDFASSTVIAQVDNGSLERWEPDGYARGGTYDAIFKGSWESYDPWDPTYRVTATSDLYNGYGVCSIFRMYQGVVALSTIDTGMIRLLPSPKLATAYFLLRPFFSPKTKAPPVEQRRHGGPEWDAFLSPDNWALDKDQSTIMHGAVPGHAQRLTELWHPHLHLRRTLVTIPALHPGDYILWHPDLAYHITSNSTAMASRAATPPPPSLDSSSDVPAPNSMSILVYVPACPLTQTNALYLARQRKTFQRGHPGPDFDATGSGLGSEASHVGRPGEADIKEEGGLAGLRAMGLEPFDVPGTPSSSSSGAGSGASTGASVTSLVDEAVGAGAGPVKVEDEDVDMDREEGDEPAADTQSTGSGPITQAEAEVARLANIILFPDRYDFWMGKRNGTGTPRVKAEKS